MDIQLIGPSALAVYIGSAELESLRLDPDELTPSGAAALLRSAQERCGLTRRGAAELELFSGRDGLLLFARLAGGRRRLLRFGALEDVISAALVTEDPPPSSLYLWDDDWWLLVTPWQAGDDLPALEEFGEAPELPEDFPAALEEHGKLLAAEDALALLRRAFSRG